MAWLAGQYDFSWCPEKPSGWAVKQLFCQRLFDWFWNEYWANLSDGQLRKDGAPVVSECLFPHCRTPGRSGEIEGWGGVGCGRFWDQGLRACLRLCWWWPGPLLTSVALSLCSWTPEFSSGFKSRLVGWKVVTGIHPELTSPPRLLLTGVVSFLLFILRARLFWNHTWK